MLSAYHFIEKPEKKIQSADEPTTRSRTNLPLVSLLDCKPLLKESRTYTAYYSQTTKLCPLWTLVRTTSRSGLDLESGKARCPRLPLVTVAVGLKVSEQSVSALKRQLWAVECSCQLALSHPRAWFKDSPSG